MRFPRIRFPRLPLPVNLPQPGTFAEGQRALFGCLVSFAGMAAFGFAVWLVLILVHGGWPEALYSKIVDYLGWALLFSLGLMALVMAALSVGGPVGRFKGGVSIKDGVNFEAEDNAEIDVKIRHGGDGG